MALSEKFFEILRFLSRKSHTEEQFNTFLTWKNISPLFGQSVNCIQYIVIV